MKNSDIIRYVKPVWGETIVDIGSGSAPYVWDLSEAVGPHGSVVLVDVDRGRVSEPLSHASDARAHIVPVWGDVTRPFGTHVGSSRVDAVIMSRIISHLVDLDTVFGEVFRIVKPGGRVIIIEEAHGGAGAPHTVSHRVDDIRAQAVRSGFSVDQYNEEETGWVLLLKRES